MKNKIILKIAFAALFCCISANVLAQTTVGPFSFYPTNLGGTMQGQAQINGVPAVAGDIIAAFNPAGNCVGAAQLTIHAGIAYINFVIYGNDGSGNGMNPGEDFYLKLYVAATGDIIDYGQGLSGWANTNFAPMPGYNNPNAVYDFASVMLNVSPSSQNVSSAAGSTSFTVTSNTSWTVSESVAWLSVTPMSGSNNGVLTVNYNENTGTARSGQITVSATGVPDVTVTVNQSGITVSLSVSPALRNVSASAGTTTFNLTSNTSWTITESTPWFTVSPMSGINNQTLTVTYQENTGSSSRQGTITASAAAATPVTVTVMQSASSNEVFVNLPDVVGVPGTIMEIPITVSNVTGMNIISCQFDFFFDPDILIPVDPYVHSSGTLTGNAGWTVLANPNVPGKLTIGGFGANSLSGEGELVAAVFEVVGSAGESTDLIFGDFLFNAGVPAAILTNGSCQLIVCGDADENGTVQAYDAALTLQHAIGIITLPPIGALNADVNMDGIITAYDAALILRYAIGLSMPSGVFTCFDDDKAYYEYGMEAFSFNAQMNTLHNENGRVSAEVLFSGVDNPGTVYSISMVLSNESAEIANLDFFNLPPDYVYYTNQTDEHTYKIAFINPYGILTDDLNIRFSYDDIVNDAGFLISDILLNDQVMPDIPLLPSSPSINLAVYPNPFTTSATIDYYLPENTHVDLSIIDFFGRTVNTLISNKQEAGFHSVAWHGDNLAGDKVPQAWYLIRITTDETLKQAKIVLIY